MIATTALPARDAGILSLSARRWTGLTDFGAAPLAAVRPVLTRGRPRRSFIVREQVRLRMTSNFPEKQSEMAAGRPPKRSIAPPLRTRIEDTVSGLHQGEPLPLSCGKTAGDAAHVGLDRSAKLPVPSLETAQARVDRAEDAAIDAGRKFDAAETKRERLTAEFITCSSRDRRDALWSKIQGAGVTYRRAKERRELAEGELVAAREELTAVQASLKEQGGLMAAEGYEPPPCQFSALESDEDVAERVFRGLCEATFGGLSAEERIERARSFNKAMWRQRIEGEMKGSVLPEAVWAAVWARVARDFPAIRTSGRRPTVRPSGRLKRIPQ